MRMTPQGGTRSPGEIFMNVVRRRARALELILGGVLLGSIVGTAGVCAAAKRPAGIVVSQNTGESLPPPIGRIRKATCHINGSLFELDGDSTDGRLHLGVVISVWQGPNREYDVLDGDLGVAVSVLDHATGNDYDNVYSVPDAPPEGRILAGAVKFGRRRAAVSFAILGIPNPDYSAFVQLRGGLQCRYARK